MALKFGWLLVLVSACAAIPDGDAEERCLAHFASLDQMSMRCWGKPVKVDAASHCENAYSVNDAELETCLAYIETSACDSWSDATYKSLCLPAFNMRSW